MWMVPLHQSVQQLAPGFRITAVAEDGVVEGIEMANGRPIFGVQFHLRMLSIRILTVRFCTEIMSIRTRLLYLRVQ